MASQDKKLAGSAQVQDSSPARVAFDLMNHIGSLERIDKKQKKIGTIGSSFMFSAIGRPTAL